MLTAENSRLTIPFPGNAFCTPSLLKLSIISASVVVIWSVGLKIIKEFYF